MQIEIDNLFKQHKMLCYVTVRKLWIYISNYHIRETWKDKPNTISDRHDIYIISDRHIGVRTDMTIKIKEDNHKKVKSTFKTCIVKSQYNVMVHVPVLVLVIVNNNTNRTTNRCEWRNEGKKWRTSAGSLTCAQM